jgi:hypothetical protein
MSRKPKFIADLITSPETWCQGEFSRDKDGCKLGSWEVNENCSYCLSGAIRRIVLDELSERHPDIPRHQLILSDEQRVAWREKLNALVPIILSHFPGRVASHSNIIVAVFNDHSATTFADIQLIVEKAKERGI